MTSKNKIPSDVLSAVEYYIYASEHPDYVGLHVELMKKGYTMGEIFLFIYKIRKGEA